MSLMNNQEIEEILNSLENKNIPNIKELSKEFDIEDMEEILEAYNILEKTKIDLIRLKEILLGGE